MDADFAARRERATTSAPRVTLQALSRGLGGMHSIDTPLGKCYPALLPVTDCGALADYLKGDL